LIKSEVSVADVLTGTRFDKDKKKNEINIIKEPLRFIYEISEAIVKAGLTDEFSNETKSFLLENCEKNKVLLTTDNNYSGEINCFMNSFRYIGQGKNLEDINRILKKNRIGKALIKYTIHPNEYWKERKKLEYSLLGKKEATIFALDKKGKKIYLVCEKI
jgi:hypothetical protein